MRIKPLPNLLANQIAAGEVIERPASVVKELLENSMDAAAKKIDIAILGGGTRAIKITDDGCGIHPEDLTLAVTSHATSKITQLEDLFAISSLGFRGEALASICSVSRCQLISKTHDQDTAYKLIVSGREQPPQIMPEAHPRGTTVLVQDLFFNTPVRRKFLYSEKTEFGHIESLVRRAALSRFNVGFKLSHDDKVILQLPAILDVQNYTTRVNKIFGSAFLAQAIFIDAEYEGLRLWGWVGLPDFMRSQNDLQYCYLNGRMIRDKLISHALRQAYESKLYPGRQPAYLLYLELDPAQVDVNVHPTKHEVRFRESRQIHDFLVSQINQVINPPTSEVVPDLSQVIETRAQYTYSPSTAVNKSPLNLKILAWLPPHYWLLEKLDQQLICNYQQLYRQLSISQLQRSDITSRPLLIPVKFTLKTVEIEKLAHYFDALEQLGLQLTQLDPQTISIRHIPIATPHLNFQKLINSLLGAPTSNPQNFINLMADANEAGKHLSEMEINALLAELNRQLTASTSQSTKEYKVISEKEWKALMSS